MAHAPRNGQSVVPWLLVAVFLAVGLVYVGVLVGLVLVFGLPTSAAGRVLAVILIGTLGSVAAMAVSRLTRKARR
jgi:hypothetical protein